MMSIFVLVTIKLLWLARSSEVIGEWTRDNLLKEICRFPVHSVNRAMASHIFVHSVLIRRGHSLYIYKHNSYFFVSHSCINWYSLIRVNCDICSSVTRHWILLCLPTTSQNAGKKCKFTRQVIFLWEKLIKNPKINKKARNPTTDVLN